MATRVILSSSVYADYAFPVGIAALLWRELVGYDPFVFIVGSEKDWSHGKPLVSYDFMREHGIETFRLDPLDDWPLHVTAQNCRYHAAALRFSSEEWLMLSDADIFPLKWEFYHQHEDHDRAFVFYYANGDHYDNYPTCHMAAKTTYWREVMGLHGDGTIMEQMAANLRAWLRPRLVGLTPRDAAMKTWMVDMHMFMDRVKTMPWHPAECRMIERAGHPPHDRLDRSAWPQFYDMAKYTDAHILKETHAPDNWKRTREIVRSLLPDHAVRIERYVTDFQRA